MWAGCSPPVVDALMGIEFILTPLIGRTLPKKGGAKNLMLVGLKNWKKKLTWTTACGLHDLRPTMEQLGLRSMTSENVPKSPKTWILRSAPKGWDMSAVESFLAASQFSAVSFTSKKLERFGTTWTFKALRNGDHSYLQLLYEGTEFGNNGKFLVAERFHWETNNAKVTKLKQEGRIPLQAKALEAIPVPPESEETNAIAETQLDEVSEDADMTTEECAKRSVAPGTSPQKKRSKVQPLPAGITRVENEGKGNCLFWAIAQSIQNCGGGVHHHSSVRAAAVTHFRKHLEKYSMFWDNKDTNDQIMEKKGIEGSRIMLMKCLL